MISIFAKYTLKHAYRYFSDLFINNTYFTHSFADMLSSTFFKLIHAVLAVMYTKSS